MKEVLKQLPQENIVYLGDTAHLPYGSKSPEAILNYTLNNVSFLLQKKIKLLIVACFSASSYALETLEKRLSIPVIGVIQCGLKKLFETTKAKRVAILGTTSTIRSGVLQNLIHTSDPSSVVFPIACPLFVPFIEEGFHEHRALRIIAEDYLAYLKTKDIDTALLACTHYPLMRPIIQEVLGYDTALIEPAETTALAAMNCLEEKGLLNRQNKKPRHRFYATDDPEKFRLSATRFLGTNIPKVLLNGQLA